MPNDWWVEKQLSTKPMSACSAFSSRNLGESMQAGGEGKDCGDKGQALEPPRPRADLKVSEGESGGASL